MSDEEEGRTTAPHPAKFSLEVLEHLTSVLLQEHPAWAGVTKTLYDPFAGTGRIFELGRRNLLVYATELEPEWANHVTVPGMVIADAFRFMASHQRDDAGRLWTDTLGQPVHVPERGFDYVVTSPTYGNRMADHHQARDGSKRHTYKHYLGRDLGENNSGSLQWGVEYRGFHAMAWRAAYKVTRPDGMIVLNVKDHIRKGSRQLVVDFHIGALERAGWEIHGAEWIGTPGLKHGENSDARVDGEWVITAIKPKT